MNRRHQLPEDDATRERSRTTRSEPRHRPETASILHLQASAGNRAVQGLLEMQVQRQPAGEAPAAEPANEGKSSASGTMSIPDMDISVPIISFMQQVGGAREAKGSSGEVVVTIALEHLDPGISKATADGRRFDTITVTIGSKATFTLRGVVFSSLNMGSDMATLSLNFTSMQFSPGG